MPKKKVINTTELSDEQAEQVVLNASGENAQSQAETTNPALPAPARKHPQGRKKGQVDKVKRKQRTDRDAQISSGENAQYIAHGLRIFELPKINLNDPAQIEARAAEFFRICSEDNMKPSYAGFALALGISRGYLWEIANGKKKTNNPAIADTIKRVTDFLTLQMEDYLQNGKINPIGAIFLMKNNMGYSDQQEVVLKPSDPLGEQNAQNAQSVLESLPESETPLDGAERAEAEFVERD